MYTRARWIRMETKMFKITRVSRKQINTYRTVDMPSEKIIYVTNVIIVVRSVEREAFK